jgi:hypothetical protein
LDISSTDLEDILGRKLELDFTWMTKTKIKHNVNKLLERAKA